MSRLRLLLALVLVLALDPPALADTPREAGDKLRASLKEPRASLAGDLQIPAHMGLARVGELRLKTEIVEKGGEKLYHLEDALSLDAKGFGAVTMTVTADLGADLSVRELVLYTSGPDAKGGVTHRRIVVAPDGDALFATEAKDDEKAVKRKLDGVPKAALLLTPLLGVGERLARLAPADVGGRFSFEAWDLATGAKGTLAVSVDEVAKVDVRGKLVAAQKVTRGEGTVGIDAWLDPTTREPLVVEREGAQRVRFVGPSGFESREDLPAPSPDERKKEGPAATVLRLLRASGRGDAAAVEALLDLDALFEAAKPQDRSEKFRVTFGKTLVALLVSPEWRRSDSVKLVADASRASDFEEEIAADKAKVRPKGAAKDGPCFELARTEQGWKVVALPRK